MNQVFGYVTTYLSGNSAWRVLATEGEDYLSQNQRQSISSTLDSPARQAPKISEGVRKNLDAIKSVIDLTHSFSKNATKGLIYFTAFNVLCYHFTGWISGVALMYFVTIVIFGWLSYDFSKLETESHHLKETFVRIVGPEDDTFYGDERPTLFIRDPQKRINDTIIHVRTAIKQINHLRDTLLVLKRPLRIPLQNIHTNLTNIELHLRSKLT